jgi:HSP20 family protein
MQRLMDRPLRGWPRLFEAFEGDEEMAWAPAVDVGETDAEYVIRADLPAVKREDIRVTLLNGALTIEGERRHAKEIKNEKMHRKESFHGTFSRSLSLPEGVDAAGIRAETKDGVLTVHVPKVPGQGAKPIEIRVQ